jgi:hypothetical protein
MKKRKPHRIAKASRISRAVLHHRVRLERSLPATAAREVHLRSLMGLPRPERGR